MRYSRLRAAPKGLWNSWKGASKSDAGASDPFHVGELTAETYRWRQMRCGALYQIQLDSTCAAELGIGRSIFEMELEPRNTMFCQHLVRCGCWLCLSSNHNQYHVESEAHEQGKGQAAAAQHEVHDLWMLKAAWGLYWARFWFMRESQFRCHGMLAKEKHTHIIYKETKMCWSFLYPSHPSRSSPLSTKNHPPKNYAVLTHKICLIGCTAQARALSSFPSLGL